MNKHLLPAAAVLALVSAGASAATISTSYTRNAAVTVAAPAGVHGAFNAAVPGAYLGACAGACTGGGMVGGPINYLVQHTGLLSIYVEDGFNYGDVYEVFVDGVSAGQTSASALGEPDGTNTTGPYSSGTFGSYAVTVGQALSIDVSDILMQYFDTPSPYGGGTPSSAYAPGQGYTPAGFFLYVTETFATAAPEPASIALLGVGLMGLGAAVGRRRRK